MSDSYYCSVCLKEVFEIKNTDNLIENIGDHQLLCEECAIDHRIVIERIIKKVWVIYESGDTEPRGVYEHKPSREFLDMIEKNTGAKIEVKEHELESFAEV